MGIESVANMKYAAKGAIVGTTAVFLINADKGLVDALLAGAKQGGYVLGFGSVNTRLCEKLATLQTGPRVAKALATTIPPALSFLVSYTMHAASGTPRPLASAAWSVAPNMVLSYVNARHFQREQQCDLEQHGTRFDRLQGYLLRGDVVPERLRAYTRGKQDTPQPF